MDNWITYDVSVLLGEESVEYPGDPPYSREILSDTLKGAEYELSRITMSSHAGTHIDAPSHFIRGGKSIDRYNAGDFVLSAVVLNIADPEKVGHAEIMLGEIEAGDAVLLKTNNSRSGLVSSGRFSAHYVYLSPDAADLLVAKKVAMVGIDYLSVDRSGDEAMPVHKKLLASGVLILENINLANVPPGRYIILCPPLKIRAESAPTRAILIKPPVSDDV